MSNMLKDYLFDIYWDYIAKNFIRKKYIANIREKFNGCTSAPSLLTCNCIGGEIYNDLGLRFTSPTINLFIRSNDFIKLAADPRYYLSKKLEFVQKKSEVYPVAMLDDIKIYFLHYDSEEQAAYKWYERCKRVDFDNLYIISDDLELTEESFEKFEAISGCKRKIMFTTNPERAVHRDVLLIKL